jgi:hypothetical protein
MLLCKHCKLVTIDGTCGPWGTLVPLNPKKKTKPCARRLWGVAVVCPPPSCWAPAVTHCWGGHDAVQLDKAAPSQVVGVCDGLVLRSTASRMLAWLCPGALALQCSDATACGPWAVHCPSRPPTPLPSCIYLVGATAHDPGVQRHCCTRPGGASAGPAHLRLGVLQLIHLLLHRPGGGRPRAALRRLAAAGQGGR